MKKKTKLFTLLLVICLGVLVACSDGQGEESSGPGKEGKSKNKEDLKFVIVPKVVHPWFDEVNKGAEEQAKILEEQLGVKVTIDYIAPSVADVAEQNSILESAAATRPDGIAVDVNDAEGSAQVIEEIRNQGIEVIFFASPPPEESDISFVGNDVYEQGEIAAKRLVELLDGKGKVAIMQGVPTASSHSERYQAHKDVLEEYPEITIIEGGISNDDIQTAQQQAASTIAANPDLDGYLMSDAAAPIGISAAIKEAGKEDQIIAVGIDSLKPILEEVKSGVLESASATIPREQGAMSVLMLWQASLGVKIPKVIDTGIDVVTQDNVDEFLDNAEDNE
ncbi:substrate-binding domain-containing protein [Pseudogracilibacillus sp. SO30301A]|uniref:substrate-binding domain-containing protein n=1 Tax=Pseudogracilibacillus sp. SO30301A TaxID=3098291 RepID=UPI00300E2B76